MKDSIQFFSEQYRKRPKLFVLGGMEELGSSQEKLHFDLGSEILLEEDDLVLLIGDKAKWIGEGILNEGGAMMDRYWHSIMGRKQFQSLKILMEQFFSRVVVP